MGLFIFFRRTLFEGMVHEISPRPVSLRASPLRMVYLDDNLRVYSIQECARRAAWGENDGAFVFCFLQYFLFLPRGGYAASMTRDVTQGYFIPRIGCHWHAGG